jgi:hypothetical protein
MVGSPIEVFSFFYLGGNLKREPDRAKAEELNDVHEL